MILGMAEYHRITILPMNSRPPALLMHELGTNPCLGITKNPRNNVARFLDTDELTRLGRALDDREARWPQAVMAGENLSLVASCSDTGVIARRRATPTLPTGI